MRREKRMLRTGILMLALFVLWTGLVQTIDVKTWGPTGTDVGFYTVNSGFHGFTGVHMWIYTLTDWLSLVPVCVCLLFGAMGLRQLINRRGLLKVDPDILLLGVYYVLVIAAYLIFEMIPINYRPIHIEGRLEASYPSSTTLLVLGVMPTLSFQAKCRVTNLKMQKGIVLLVKTFSLMMVVGRLVCGVHWLTDILGSVLLSKGLFCVYQAAVMMCCGEKE